MKTLVLFVLAVMASMVVACCKPDPPKPPVVKVKPAVAIKAATNVEITKATLVAKVVPNENGTSIVFDYKAQTDANWTTVPVSGLFSGKDSVEVSVVLTTLTANTEYVFRCKAANEAGQTISSEVKFQAYAVKDYDGNYYHTVTIGTQTWLKENLKTTHFANGDPIPNIKEFSVWNVTNSVAYCYYNNDPEVGKTYGALYNWFVTNDPRGLIAGYHVATDEEWTILMNSQGGRSSAGGKLKEVGLVHWKAPNAGATNESGFTSLPAGARDFDVFCEIAESAYFWSSTQYGPGALAKHTKYATTYFENDVVVEKKGGFSLRLIKN